MNREFFIYWHNCAQSRMGACCVVSHHNSLILYFHTPKICKPQTSSASDIKIIDYIFSKQLNGVLSYLTKIILYFDQTGTNLTDHAISLCNANTSHVMLLTILYDLFIKLSFLCSVIKCVCQTSTSSSLYSYLQSLLLRE